MSVAGITAWQEWRADRHRSVTAATGNLALVETRWLPAGETPDLDAARADVPTTVTVTALERTDMVTGAPEHGLRFWDAESPAIRAFDRVDTYAYDPAWVVDATYTPVEGARTVAFEHLRDNGGTREKVVPGDIAVTLDGTDYTLSAFDDDGTLLLVFGDPTNGTDTYGAGRFLFVEHTGEGRVRLDFNRAFVPPCGFSDQYNCPMPPRQNRLHLPVEAGEKLPVLRGGAAGTAH
ncbi:DUF1684 domain-containing protein [Streptomyces sp. VRA16 Mangrove soil]|uniref:DUF1684 domain-containing protein n=1 Tax=Streptomyces sp. VRA16 Mangrove soil TaxID=2817434 RepID=UPI001A9F87F0|nr:DUF1684 domain-containing protein [Streptomyces sp. VRA16 Mangrove soil]MBO1330012.1 DUF1684 domain-containing protein [Streptomyces sp. VRA16 Mangrove soil]